MRDFLVLHSPPLIIVQLGWRCTKQPLEKERGYELSSIVRAI
jgi:hypothetical protein